MKVYLHDRHSRDIHSTCSSYFLWNCLIPSTIFYVFNRFLISLIILSLLTSSMLLTIYLVSKLAFPGAHNFDVWICHEMWIFPNKAYLCKVINFGFQSLKIVFYHRKYRHSFVFFKVGTEKIKVKCMSHVASVILHVHYDSLLNYFMKKLP